MKAISYIRWAALAIAGIVVVIIGLREAISMSKTPIDLNDPAYDWSELQAGDHVEMDITYLFDQFSTTTKDGKEAVRYYAMPRIVSSDGQYYEIKDFIAVDVNDSSLNSKYDKLSSDTIDWWIDESGAEFKPETIHFDGVVKKLKDNTAGFFKDYLKQLKYEDSFINGSQYELGIFPAQNGNIAIIIIGVLITLVGIGGIVIKFVRK